MPAQFDASEYEDRLNEFIIGGKRLQHNYEQSFKLLLFFEKQYSIKKVLTNSCNKARLDPNTRK